MRRMDLSRNDSTSKIGRNRSSVAERPGLFPDKTGLPQSDRLSGSGHGRSGIRAFCRIAALLICCLGMMTAGMAAEGDPLLSVDDLILLEPSYEQFLWDLGSLLVERGLLAEEEKTAWIRLQMGDYLSNGGYGSILTTFYPGLLAYAQEEEQFIELQAVMDEGTVTLLTMKKYSPLDSNSDGLMMLFSMFDTADNPLQARFELESTDGVFYRWDAISGSYVNVGMSLEIEGETIFWSCPVPVDGSVGPIVHIRVYETQEDRFLGQAMFQLEVANNSYLEIQENFITEHP